MSEDDLPISGDGDGATDGHVEPADGGGDGTRKGDDVAPPAAPAAEDATAMDEPATAEQPVAEADEPADEPVADDLPPGEAPDAVPDLSDLENLDPDSLDDDGAEFDELARAAEDAAKAGEAEENAAMDAMLDAAVESAANAPEPEPGDGPSVDAGAEPAPDDDFASLATDAAEALMPADEPPPDEPEVSDDELDAVAASAVAAELFAGDDTRDDDEPVSDAPKSAALDELLGGPDPADEAAGDDVPPDEPAEEPAPVPEPEPEVEPEYSMLERIIEQVNLFPPPPPRDDYEDDDPELARIDSEQAALRRATSAMLARMLSPDPETGRLVIDADATFIIDDLIAEVDEKLCRQLDAILHNPIVQALESAWRGLWWLASQVDFRENVRLHVWNVPKQVLIDDFEDSPEIVQTGMYKWVYTEEYGQFGGEPWGAIISGYEFDQSARDMELIKKISSISTMSHAPFIAAAAARMFGLDSFYQLPELAELRSEMEAADMTRWQSFRETEPARSVALTLPRMLMRLPWSQESSEITAFQYNEVIDGNHENYLWGSPALAFGSRLADSFAAFRWCPNIIGPQSGGV